MELRQLKTFVAIADRGSFVAAGEHIGLTSRQLAYR